MKTYLVSVTTSWAVDWDLRSCETRKIMTENVNDIFKLIADEFEDRTDIIVSNIMIEPYIPSLEEIDAQQIKDYLVHQEKQNWKGWGIEERSAFVCLIENIRNEVMKDNLRKE
jgi:hypothetical protein